MLPPLAASSSGLAASMTGLQVAAHNIANASVNGFRRQSAEPMTSAPGGVEIRLSPFPEPGGALEADVVDLLQQKNAFLANLAVFRRADEALATLIDAVS